MTEETIECPMKVMDIFPYGKVLVPDMKKLREKIKYIEMRKKLGLKIVKLKSHTKPSQSEGKKNDSSKQK